ncbi:hypothetical protein M422DRAFT_780869 [Sphaerobolus stellatus SS14]|uniref:DNA repair and recombination protein RAD54B n=1 Tax=Sphaerobolus stellatus (strain SS14) TaxID=990650 RepID=A0A0C9U9T6_SPHS4|nr:hypothetical protein M422DRAFT_780869 [Sphaerobolus stellatus SS14]
MLPLTTTENQKKRKSDGLDNNPHPPKQANYADSTEDTPMRNRITYWNVQWRAPQTKKHKTWDGDSVVAITSSAEGGVWCTLYDGERNILSRSRLKLFSVKIGDTFKMGEKEYEVDFQISRKDFDSGMYFAGKTSSVPVPCSSAPSPAAKKPFARITPSTTVRKGISLHPVNLIKQTARTETVDDLPKAKSTEHDAYWTINWSKAGSSKKNKSWENDGYLMFNESSVSMLSESGKSLGTSTWKGPQPYEGLECHLNGKQVRLDKPVSLKEIPTTMKDNDLESVQIQENAPAVLPPPKKFVAPVSFYGAPPPKVPSVAPRHDPDAEGAIVLKAPNKAHEVKYNKRNRPVVPVVLDPSLAKHLRPHQVEGVKFMYECVMGMRKHEGQGCILADEMGMGKTLQTVTLIWTLLKQSPYATGSPVMGKCLIACPVSLVNNWKKEFQKWLGRDRVGIFVGDKDKTVIKQFVNSKIHQVLVIGYERLKGVMNDLVYCQPPIGLIVCDEGHRLKSAQSKVNQMFDKLKVGRRIILSGTPIQNNLEELHAMTDFCNPGLLDDYSSFKRLYENPIMKSRTPGCSKKELELGNTRSAQLLAICNSFVLRRDAGILNNYLPPKFEYVVFVKPTELQLSVYAQILEPTSLNTLMKGPMARSLAMINKLTKISNSPLLLRVKDDDLKIDENENSDAGSSSNVQDAVRLLPKGASLDDVSLSGKLTALADILGQLRKNTEEKCIVVSHYTSALDAIQAYCDKKRYTYVRLDGRVPATKRQPIVDSFNKSPQKECFIFLLSAKAGGVGLNLIGASRLVLVDSDWNPSHDLQAMARIHRDGQKRPVYIYRLLTTGTIDEKIYQRQIIKMGLSDCLMAGQSRDGSNSKTDSFSPEDLRDLFNVHSRTPCHTHDLLGCICAGPAIVSQNKDEDSDSENPIGWMIASQVNSSQLDRKYAKKRKAELASLGEWTHINCMIASARSQIHDDILRKLIIPPGVEKALTSDSQTQSRSQRLLEEFDSLVDTDNLKDEEGADMSEVPGGRVTYVFEKRSDSSL